MLPGAVPFRPFEPLADPVGLAGARLAGVPLAAVPDAPVPLVPLVPLAPPVPLVAPPAPLACPVPAGFGFGSARSVRSTTGLFLAPAAPVAAVGGPATMPFRNRISCVRIRMALETMK